jgi:peptidyl-tRNA hydrolase
MTHIDLDSIPRVVLVFNGPLKMSPGKMAAQAFQACERIFDEMHAEGLEHVRERVYAWREHTTTIARVAKTTAMFDRVCAEVPGVVMVDEGFTEVDPDTPTVFASWPAAKTEEHKLLSNAKVQLLRDVVDLYAGWTDDQVRALAQTLEVAHGGIAPDYDTAITDALRAEAASRHLRLLSASGEEVAPEQWLSQAVPAR